MFENKEISHVENNMSPLNNIEIIEMELIYQIFKKLENIIENLKKNKGLKLIIK